MNTHANTHTRDTITLGRSAVRSPLASAEIRSTPHPNASPNISNCHGPAAPCPYHQSAPAPVPLINDDPRWGRGIWGRRKGDRCCRFDHLRGAAVPMQPKAGAAFEDWKGGEEKKGGASPSLPPHSLQVTFKFRGSGAGSCAAPAGNVTPSDVSGQAKYNLVSTWKDVL